MKGKILPHWTKLILPTILLAILFGCGGDMEPDFHSLLDEQPHVLEIQPPNQTILQEPIYFTLSFSHRISLQDIHAHSVALISGEIESSLMKNTKGFMKEFTEDQFSQVPVQYFLEEDEKVLTIVPEEELSPGIYHLVVTPLLQSVNGVPFNQSPGESSTAFIATFGFGENITLTSTSQDTGNLAPTFGPAPEILVINEFLYDGLESETNGEAFVELMGTPTADISLYEISLINGANGEVTDRITLPVGTVLPEDGIFVVADLNTNSSTQTGVEGADFLDQFDPQNGPDAVHLINREGELLDSVWYGEGAVPTTPEGLPLGEGIPAPDVTGGHSLSRVGGSDSQDNSVDFIDLEYPTPGSL